MEFEVDEPPKGYLMSTQYYFQSSDRLVGFCHAPRAKAGQYWQIVLLFASNEAAEFEATVMGA
jgi:hypothetical protein